MKFPLRSVFTVSYGFWTVMCSLITRCQRSLPASPSPAGCRLGLWSFLSHASSWRKHQKRGLTFCHLMTWANQVSQPKMTPCNWGLGCLPGACVRLEEPSHMSRTQKPMNQEMEHQFQTAHITLVGGGNSRTSCLMMQRKCLRPGIKGVWSQEGG